MANPLLLDIVQFLTNAGCCTGDGVDAFRDNVPDKPDNLIAVIEYKGDYGMLVDEAVHRSVQVLARSKDADLARQKALGIYKAIQAAQGEDGRVDYTSSRFGQTYLRQPPMRSMVDENNRVYYTFNIGVTTNIE